VRLQTATGTAYALMLVAAARWGLGTAQDFGDLPAYEKQPQSDQSFFAGVVGQAATQIVSEKCVEEKAPVNQFGSPVGPSHTVCTDKNTVQHETQPYRDGSANPNPPISKSVEARSVSDPLSSAGTSGASSSLGRSSASVHWDSQGKPKATADDTLQVTPAFNLSASGYWRDRIHLKQVGKPQGAIGHEYGTNTAPLF